MAVCMVVVLFAFILLGASQFPPDEPDKNLKPNLVLYNTGKTTEGSLFQKNLETVIKFLFQHNPPNGFATSLGYGDFPNTAYGHSGCYNMTDQQSCSECIQNAYRNMQQVAPLNVGGVLWINDTQNRCRLRYEAYNFTQDQVVSLGVLGVVGPNVSAPAPAPTSPTVLASPSLPSSSQSSSTAAIVGGVVGGLCFLLGFVGILVWRWRRKYTKLDERHRYQGGRTDLETSVEGPVVFTYDDLSIATGNFNERNKLGKGGFGTVYKAQLNDGTRVAVKKLALQSQQGRKEFVNEINIITSIQHRNLVRLKGYCIHMDERLVVYEFLEKGSLDGVLFDSNSASLNWHYRFQIAIGVARGLAYLHEEAHIQIIHRDIKTSNILLDEKLQPKISDFGISKLFDIDKGFTSTNVAGTFGYMAPEYVTRGRLTAKADVFSYGILVLEIVSGRKCVDSTLGSEEELLLPLMWNFLAAGEMESCIDKRLGRNYVTEEADRLIRVAMLCTQQNEESRPTMSDVVAMLLGYLEVNRLPDQAPIYFPGKLQGGSPPISITTLEAR